MRICAIFRKGNIQLDNIKKTSITLTQSIEHVLAIKILEFPDLIYSVADDLSLHRMCDYLCDLAGTYHRFYEHCPILSTEDENIRNSRLLLSNITARVLKAGLDLLGIQTLDKM